MKKVLVVLVAWMMMVGVGTACAVEDPSCSQSQFINNKTDIKNTNTNIVAPVQIVNMDIDPVVKSSSISGAVSGSASKAITGPSTSSATSSATGGSASGGSATAYGGAGGQGGNATASANPTSNANNSLTVISPENKRELPNIPSAPGVSQLEYRGPYGKGMYQFIAPWQIVNEWTPEMINNFPSCVWNCDVEVARVWKSIFDQKKFKVVKQSGKKLIGWIIIKATNPLEMWGKVAQYAFDMGAEEVVENAFQSTFSNKSGGWNVGLGGGATAVSGSGDNIGGSFGGGTGFGSVETQPVEKCQAAFTFYGK